MSLFRRQKEGSAGQPLRQSRAELASAKMERKSPRDENPYLSARREYGDRYGSAVRDAATWRRFCMGTLVLLAVFGGGMLWLASTNKVVPYIVQVDKQGYAVAIKPGTQVAERQKTYLSARRELRPARKIRDITRYLC